MEYKRGLIECLFDTSFTEFITTRFIKFLFVLGLILAAIGSLTFVVGGFQSSVGSGILCLIIAPFLFVLYAIMIRIWLELIIVIFRIEENTRPAVAEPPAPPQP